MPTHNSDVIDRLNEIADLLELKDANPFRVRAYRNAARTIEALPKRLETMIEEGEDLSDLNGVGEDLAGKIRTLVETGDLPLLDDLKAEIPSGLLEVMDVPSLGPKRTQQLARDLDIESLDDLQRAAEQHDIRELDGFGEKTEAAIAEELERLRSAPGRFPLAEAEERVSPLVDYLAEQEGVGEVTVAGSFRRRRETVGDIDILVTSNANTKVMDAFADYEDVEEVLSKGSTRSSVRLRGGLQADLRVVPKKSYGAAMLYFTGSKAHNIKLRKMALDRDRKINEYGVFHDGTAEAGRTEEEMYAALDLPFVPPELREDRGEVEAAASGALPELVALDDIRGDLHVHTRASDGVETMQRMVEAARERGYAYLAVTDHSEHVGVTQGLDADGLAKQAESIRRKSEELDGFTLLAGVELDIREDGGPALPESVLAELDVVVASVHTAFGLGRKRQTRRILKAMEHEVVHALGHPTGRLLGRREAYDVDMDEIVRQAEKGGWCIELNAHPMRLDLTDAYCKRARERGVRVLLDTDAHRTGDLDNMRYGVGQARRGWLAAGDVVNTRSAGDARDLLKRT